MDIPAMRVSLADISFVDYSTGISLYLRICRNI